VEEDSDETDDLPEQSLIPPQQAPQREPKQDRLMGQTNRDVHDNTPDERFDEDLQLHLKGV
jgi:hypothetical protein